MVAWLFLRGLLVGQGKVVKAGLAIVDLVSGSGARQQHEPPSNGHV